MEDRQPQIGETWTHEASPRPSLDGSKWRCIGFTTVADRWPWLVLRSDGVVSYEVAGTDHLMPPLD